MLPDILIRLAWALIIITAGVGVYWMLRWLILARVQHKQPGLESLTPGIPGILYFTTPHCVPCKTVQRPALEDLREVLGEGIQIIQIDATKRTDLADSWGVLSVPTTFIIDSKGQPRHINHGVTRAAKLLDQLESVEGRKLLPEEATGLDKVAL
ncbi:MAG: thioredoxin family protein [Chloroflexi bacterium]|nr:thioredoxin family protein [Chloroflexota bacterium]